MVKWGAELILGWGLNELGKLRETAEGLGEQVELYSYLGGWLPVLAAEAAALLSRPLPAEGAGGRAGGGAAAGEILGMGQKPGCAFHSRMGGRWDGIGQRVHAQLQTLPEGLCWAGRCRCRWRGLCGSATGSGPRGTGRGWEL